MESAGIDTQTPVKVNEVAVAFPPYRRSPLKSKTLQIFVRILSLYDYKSLNNANIQIISENPVTDDQCKEPEVTTQEGLQDGNLLAENAMESSDIQIQKEALNSSEILHEVEHMVGIEEKGEQQFDPLIEEKYLTIVNELENTVMPELYQGAQALMDNKVDDTKDMTSCSEMNLANNMECERCQIDTITLVDSSLMPLDDDENEEGEILDGGVSIQSDESFLKDSLALEERNADVVVIELERQQVEIDLLVNRPSSPLDNQDTEEGEILDAPSVPYLVETVDTLSNFTEAQEKFGKGGGMEEKSNTTSGGKTLNVKEPSCGAGGKEVNGSSGSCNFLLNDPVASSPSRELKIAMERSENTSTELRERKKRAEKNRQQGVKRLKLQPITKPKPPCKFLPRNSCLKGDDCPFDHQLSKYACDRFKSNGFCERGDKCLFSHEIKSIESSNLASTSGQKEPEPSSLQNNMSSQTPKTVKETSAKMPVVDAALKTKEQTAKGSDIIGKRQLNSSSPSLQIVKKIRETNSSAPSSNNLIHRHQSKYVTNSGLRQPPTQAPKGISFLSFVKPPLNDTNKLVHDSSPSERGRGSETHNGNNQNESEKFRNANETPCGTPASPFLPLCQSPTFATAEKTRNSNGPPWKIPASKISFGESPSAGLELQKNSTPTASSAQKALLSTMAFASKYRAEMIGNSTQTPLSNDLNNGTKVGNFPCSGRIQRSSMSASKILQEFLFAANDDNKA
ncbi:hypothetical protein Sjap_011706 [Stephania japonica]|uniref:C3H1-type domain-containing protein n=1 Tax=Stephania japonica TaxID=461633 RepID=A0AAP0JBX0_9MAGN